MSKTVLFETIQFSISNCLVLFNPIRYYHSCQGAMAIKEYSTFLKAPALLRLFSVIPGHSLRESYMSAVMQSVYILQPKPTGPQNSGQ